jgi:hypothetical protein
MSQHSQRTQAGPSMTSIVTGAVFTLVDVAIGMWIIAGSGLDGRHVTGYIGWMVLAVLLGGRTIVRLAEWQSIREQARERRRRLEQEAVRAAQEAVERQAKVTGTWTGDGPGQVLTVRLDDEGNLAVQGWLSDHWQQQDERIWSYPVGELVEMVRELERSGELGPVNDEGTVFMRTMLDLGAWPLPSFDELERDWSRRDGDTQVVSQTA